MAFIPTPKGVGFLGLTLVKSTSKLWISSADNLPRHVESDTEIPVTKIGGKSHSIIVYEYNLNISIKAPI